MIKRREAAAVRLPPPSTRRAFMPSHLSFSFSSPPSLSTSTEPDDGLPGDNASLASSVFSGLMHPGRVHVVYGLVQADSARLTNALKVLAEVNQRCWRGDECELCTGVRQGVSSVAQHVERHGDAVEHRVRSFYNSLTLLGQLLTPLKARTMMYSTLEALKVGSLLDSQSIPLTFRYRANAIYTSPCATCLSATTGSPETKWRN